ncbi:type II secretion system protein, partial [bacterium]|nr:type II secretion system protein [bacterium]
TLASNKQTLMSNDDRLTQFLKMLNRVTKGTSEPNLSGMLKQVQHDKNWFALSQVQGDSVLAKHRGFTLAEVLITLGIIGVVAALAIPTLISNNNKRIVETRLAKFYSTMNQAIELSEVENGPKEKWDNLKDNPSEWFRKYLEPYVKTSKVDYGDTVSVYFHDGSLVRFGSTGWNFYPQAKSFDKDNAVAGKDVFNFLFNPAYASNEPEYNIRAKKYHIGKGLEPYMYDWNGEYEYLKTSPHYGCKQENVTYVQAYCAKLIQENGWKIPDDYPFKF